MDIVVENCWAAGASLTSNTNECIIKCFEWLEKYNIEAFQYTEFYKSFAKTEGLSTSNLRNIFPLLRRLGLISDYSKGVFSKSFFTCKGKAYVELLKLWNEIEYEDNKKDLLKEISVVQKEIVLDGLVNDYLCNNDIDRKAKIPLLQMLWFLNKFNKINKVEFAYMLSSLSNFREDIYPVQDISLVVDNYRKGKTQINVKVSVRDDVTKSGKNVLQSFSYFASFGYNIALIEQSGIVTSDGEYYYLEPKNLKLVDKCLEVNKNG